MDEVIEANKYLLLPRLSSQLFFNQLCPSSSDPRNKRQDWADWLVSFWSNDWVWFDQNIYQKQKQKLWNFHIL